MEVKVCELEWRVGDSLSFCDDFPFLRAWLTSIRPAYAYLTQDLPNFRVYSNLTQACLLPTILVFRYPQ